MFSLFANLLSEFSLPQKPCLSKALEEAHHLFREVGLVSPQATTRRQWLESEGKTGVCPLFPTRVLD